jgi:hypothetical protein
MQREVTADYRNLLEPDAALLLSRTAVRHEGSCAVDLVRLGLVDLVRIGDDYLTPAFR